MRHIRREVDEITGTHLGGKLEPLPPTYPAMPFHDVDRYLVAPKVMRPGLCIGLERDGADPRFLPPATYEIKCGRASMAGTATSHAGHLSTLLKVKGWLRGICC